MTYDHRPWHLIEKYRRLWCLFAGCGENLWSSLAAPWGIVIARNAGKSLGLIGSVQAQVHDRIRRAQMTHHIDIALANDIAGDCHAGVLQESEREE